MVIKWDEVFKNEQRQFERMSQAEKYVYSLLLQYGSPYVWGAENPEGADCSGSVCLALFMATGFRIRTTADDLFRRFFTVKEPNPGTIRAAFFINGNGKAEHVAGLVGETAVLNAQEPGARIKGIDELANWFFKRGMSTVVRGLNRAAFESLAKQGVEYGIDKQMGLYFE